jgi:hypothetical protein
MQADDVRYSVLDTNTGPSVLAVSASVAKKNSSICPAPSRSAPIRVRFDFAPSAARHSPI